ncbi:uncharacterized protein SETTUDRAFT_19973 [Exserohilum turcica Et28A]|uniref:Phosducin n=1 Tax=Exserohilum turcicum (strain 28A) TaxID=671987 RepID=R0K2U2_EXST2|nr:uncharacterized protein SETTUDRAFT_19973 [Exserohilum turcica Et28A]EOA87453.1 hypothetical protein SETTUDRAFT_19973 [Exserohilum turcica Et28A]
MNPSAPSPAQDEFNELFRDKHTDARHPEDGRPDSDVSDPESPGAAADYLEKIDTDDELDLPADMRANYYMPSLRSEANTGPKGVIADAQAFEQAKKQARRFTWKKNSPPPQYTVKAYHDDKTGSSDDDEDAGFMRQWREARLKELQTVGDKMRSRTNSPSRKIYGTMPLVDGEGYLDAVDKTTVIACTRLILRRLHMHMHTNQLYSYQASARMGAALRCRIPSLFICIDF